MSGVIGSCRPSSTARTGTKNPALPDGYYVDFTALAAAYGWERVPAADNWRTFFPGIRY